LAQLTVQAIGFEVTWPSAGGPFWQLNPPENSARPSPGPAKQVASNADAAIFARNGKQETVFIDVLP
jgi:hypothetical protein